jgi:hypothetical protein
MDTTSSTKEAKIHLRLTETRAFGNGVVLLRYARAKAPSPA